MTQWGLDALFNPAKRHMDEEKRRLQSTREEIGDASGGKRIDLESGKVRIARSEPAETDDADQADTDAEVQPAEEKTRTAAQQRSAARRRAIRKQAAADRQAKAGGKQAAGATDEATDTSES